MYLLYRSVVYLSNIKTLKFCLNVAVIKFVLDARYQNTLDTFDFMGFHVLISSKFLFVFANICPVVIFDVNQIMWRHMPHVHDIIRDRAHKYMVIIMSRRSMSDNLLSKTMSQQFYKWLVKIIPWYYIEVNK